MLLSSCTILLGCQVPVWTVCRTRLTAIGTFRQNTNP